MKRLIKIHQENARENKALAKTLRHVTIFMPVFYLFLFVILPLIVCFIKWKNTNSLLLFFSLTIP